MNRTHFWPGVVAALGLSLTGALVFHALAVLIEPALAMRVLLPVLAAACLLWLIVRHRVRVGRLANMVGLVLLAAALLLLNPPLWLWLMTLTVWLWLMRSLLVHHRLLAATVDGLLSALALTAAVTAFTHSASVFLALWSFFLVQSLYVFIPDRTTTAPDVPAEDPFQRAERNARHALRRLAQPSLFMTHSSRNVFRSRRW
jgi:hypothetical protein